MVSTDHFEIVSPDDEPMGNPPASYPRNVLIWRVSFDEEDNEFRLFYVECATVDLGSTDHDAFLSYLEKVVDGDEPDDGGGPDDWHEPRETEPGETPLSIEYDGYSYMIFVIRGKKWRFSKRSAPFTVERDYVHKYLMARCAWRDPTNGSLRVTDKPGQDQNDPDCTVAFFIADVRNQGEGNRVSFNIFVDLAMTRRSDRKRHVPIVVDPDVGYPGGSYP